MIHAADETARLRALYETGLLDTVSEPRFDRYTRLASAIADAPIALISLIDANRQWFKSCIGLNAQETAREYAFCDHAIRQRDLFVIPDATADARFATNPLVTGEPHIRFYAGAPLILSDGAAIGTLCIIDTKPRSGLTEVQSGAILDLAGLVLDEIVQRRDARNRETAIAELQHRISNLFGQVAGLMSLAISGEQTREEYITDLRNRVESLNQLNRQLAKGDWNAGQLSDIVLSAILPVIGGRRDRLTIDGQPLEVNAKAAMAISLALSELSVNSIKHGVLGRDEGEARLAWTIADGTFVLVWDEQGPANSSVGTIRPGFGSTLLRKIAPRDLNGEAQLDLLNGRLTYRLTSALQNLT